MTPSTTLTDGTPVTPDHRELRADGQQKAYVVLSEDERAKGFVRPVRRSYVHVGARPRHPVRGLTPDEQARYAEFGYAKYEQYPPGSGLAGKFWTAKQLASGCGTSTTMGQALAETYARQPDFYSATFCCACGAHFPVGEHGEFVWADSAERVGT